MVTWGRVREAEGEEWDRSNLSISSWDTRSSMLAYATVIERKKGALYDAMEHSIN